MGLINQAEKKLQNNTEPQKKPEQMTKGGNYASLLASASKTNTEIILENTPSSDSTDSQNGESQETEVPQEETVQNEAEEGAVQEDAIQETAAPQKTQNESHEAQEAAEDPEELEQPPEPAEPQAAENNDSADGEIDVSDFLGEEEEHKQLTEEELKDKLKEEQLALEREKAEIEKRANEEKEAKRQEAKQLKLEKKANRVRRPIGVTLVLLISLLVIGALGGVTYLVSYFITQDIRINAEENNLAINSRTAADCENRIENVISSVQMFIDLLSSKLNNEAETKKIESLFFERNKDIVAIYLPVTDNLFINTSFIISHEMEKDGIATYFKQEEESTQEAQNGKPKILNSSAYFSIPLLSIFYPVTAANGDNAMCVLYSAEAMSESFASGTINQSFFVNTDGIILVHSDVSLMMSAADDSTSPIVKAMHESDLSNSQISYLDSDGEEYIGAFRKINSGNGGVITIAKTSVVLEGIHTTTRRNILITVAILAFSIMIIYIFSRSLSKPLRELTEIVNEINKGNVNTELFNKLTDKRQDEIGVLIHSTKNEREILNMFSRLTNMGVTKAIITKKIDFQPHLKDITIFFSDIRGFTAISDGFKERFGEESAGEIINFLNDYMSRMVTCIRQTGGVIDKFEGDAIMAAWGVLRNESLEWENMGRFSVTRALQQEAHDKYVREDALSAITSCIAMRYSLMKYNKDAQAFTEAHKDEPKAQYKPHIRIGAGLNTGRATVGFMGSYDKMEFTSIGDAVNFASRTEASNKPCGTDILITEETYGILKEKYIRCEENNYTLASEDEKNELVVERIPVEFEVKGKGKQHFYGVVNMPNFDIKAFFEAAEPGFELDPDCEKAVGPNGPKTLNEMRTLLGIPIPDFEKVNLDAEENKIQVANP